MNLALHRRQSGYIAYHRCYFYKRNVSLPMPSSYIIMCSMPIKVLSQPFSRYLQLVSALIAHEKGTRQRHMIPEQPEGDGVVPIPSEDDAS